MNKKFRNIFAGVAIAAAVAGLGSVTGIGVAAADNDHRGLCKYQPEQAPALCPNAPRQHVGPVSAPRMNVRTSGGSGGHVVGSFSGGPGHTNG